MITKTTSDRTFISGTDGSRRTARARNGTLRIGLNRIGRGSASWKGFAARQEAHGIGNAFVGTNALVVGSTHDGRFIGRASDSFGTAGARNRTSVGVFGQTLQLGVSGKVGCATIGTFAGKVVAANDRVAVGGW